MSYAARILDVTEVKLLQMIKEGEVPPAAVISLHGHRYIKESYMLIVPRKI